MIKHDLRTNKFTRFPQWICPACSRGVLTCDSDMVKRWPAKGVAEGIDEGYIFRWDDYGVFSATLKCSNQSCSQGVACVGDYSAYEFDDPPMAYGFEYTIRYIHPAILLIDIPRQVPDSIESALKRSFGLFWNDPRACAGAIRVAIEDVVAHLGYPRMNDGRFVPLATRLKKLKSDHPQVVEAAEAIKIVGNDGAHGDDVTADKLIACYDLLEIELRRLFSDDDLRRRAAIESLKTKQ